MTNLKRDPFEIAVGEDTKTLLGAGGALAAPSTTPVSPQVGQVPTIV
jgi:hypothetical protein